MPRRLESGIEADACDRVRLRYGVVGLKFTPVGRPGYPDRFFPIPGGRPLLMEFKRPGETPEPLQDHYLAQFFALGYNVCWVDSVEKALYYVGLAMGDRFLEKSTK